MEQQVLAAGQGAGSKRRSSLMPGPSPNTTLGSNEPGQPNTSGAGPASQYKLLRRHSGGRASPAPAPPGVAAATAPTAAGPTAPAMEGAQAWQVAGDGGLEEGWQYEAQGRTRQGGNGSSRRSRSKRGSTRAAVGGGGQAGGSGEYWRRASQRQGGELDTLSPGCHSGWSQGSGSSHEVGHSQHTGGRGSKGGAAGWRGMEGQEGAGPAREPGSSPWSHAAAGNVHSSSLHGHNHSQHWATGQCAGCCLQMVVATMVNVSESGQ
ncbi:hypothetical protein V8C86DRAFT_1368162 [Haematococcus lacustris]